MPIAAYAVTEDAEMRLGGLVASLDGARVLRSRVEGTVQEAEALGSGGRHRGA